MVFRTESPSVFPRATSTPAGPHNARSNTFVIFYPFFLSRGVIERGETDVKLSFAVISRDHLCYSPQADDLWLTEFDALIWAFSNTNDLTECISKLQSFEWLPVEGKDFIARFELSTLAGETIECEVFHPV
jgi:hypothetical protein